MTDSIRLLDLHLVPPVRSQTVYHAVAYAMDADSPDTIIFVNPSDPYVCIGFHQELEKEVDVEYCRAHGLPIYRREVGGGAVYLDRDQVFVQWIFHRDKLPTDLGERFALYVKPIVETYQALGIPANYRPINDIHVQGKKIGGTGAAQIGIAEVVVGSFMFDFNFELMSKVLKVSSEKMRDKIFQSLNEYMTTMTRQLGHTPEREAVMTTYREKVETILGHKLIRGELSTKELQIGEQLDAQFASDEWLHQKGGLRQQGVKIHADVRVVETANKAPGGLIRVTARLHDHHIDDVLLSGDFTLLPRFATGALELALRGVSLENDAVLARIAEVYRSVGIESPGVTPQDLTKSVMLLEQSQN
ncbi:MAG: lipoate--protein ligase family protein [Chloroflexi bacterium]|nr:lipoate--protein ligase family protein [Chloroflexota bacterium]